MVLFLGVCRALKAMHEYKVGGKGAGKAKRLRAEAAEADEDAAQAAGGGRRRGRGDESDREQQEPLMDDEVTQSQEGVAPGGARAYAHRDIKPGKHSYS